jgi:hypothetical protein
MVNGFNFNYTQIKSNSFSVILYYYETYAKVKNKTCKIKYTSNKKVFHDNQLNLISVFEEI